MKKSWYCYVCGEKLNKEYFLFSMNKSTDRVFLVCKEKDCIERINGEDMIIIKVREEI